MMTRKYQNENGFKSYNKQQENWKFINKTPEATVMQPQASANIKGVTEPDENLRGSLALGDLGAVFQAEALAIKY